MTMLKATAALSHLFDGNNVDPDKVTIIICADDPDTRAKIEISIAMELGSLMFTHDEKPKCTWTAFKLHGVRVVLSDLTHEEPMYLITKDAPR